MQCTCSDPIVANPNIIATKIWKRTLQCRQNKGHKLCPEATSQNGMRSYQLHHKEVLQRAVGESGIPGIFPRVWHSRARPLGSNEVVLTATSLKVYIK